MWLVDIGDRVAAGQTLAIIDAPEVDQELRQAVAAEAQSKAVVLQSKTQLELARTTSQRWAALRPSGVVSQQDVDQRQATFDAQQSNLSAMEAAVLSSHANVMRLRELEGFANVVAPFAGVVTARTTENGQLVVAGTSNGQPLFKVAEVDVIRVFINVPQLYASAIRVGQEVPTQIREFPGRSFTGRVTRTANALDPNTRTLLTEVHIKNDGGELMAGMYAEVTLQVERTSAPLLVPSTALLIDASGTRVATVANGELHWRKIVIDADLGAELAVASGISEGDELAKNASDRLVEGMKVKAEEASAL
jgi:RND family efflux transporter MFP subunit